MTEFIENQGGRIAYEEMGSGQPVICVPSMGDVRAEYRYLLPQLAAAGYRAVSMDVRGHGESSVGWDDYSVAGVGSDILALIRELNAGPALIVGTSMAAGASVWAAAEAPDKIAAQVLIGPFVRGGGDTKGKLLFSLLFARPWGPGMWVRYYQTLYPTRKPEDFKAYCAALRTNLSVSGRLEALKQMLFASKAASEERLPRVTAPTLVLMGTKDPDFKNQEVEAQWVAQATRGTYKMIEGAGHYPHAEMPQVTGELILSFLKAQAKTKEMAYAA